MKTVAIIQARTSSSRLPFKIKKNISGHPLLFHVVERAKKIKNVDELLIATTMNFQDDWIDKFAQKNNVKVFRGSENDLLDRFQRAASYAKADLIVRICADSPLFDPSSVGKIILAVKKAGADFVRVVGNNSKAGGINVLSRNAIDRAALNATEPYEREHVIPYIVKNPGKFKFINFEFPNDRKIKARLTIDTNADLLLITEIYKKLYRENKIVSLSETLTLLNHNRYLLRINSHVKRVSKSRPGFKIFILTSANMKNGYGHLFRMIKLAEVLTERFSNGIKFVVDGDEYSKELIVKRGFEYIPFSKAFVNKYDQLKSDAIIIDSHQKALINFFALTNKENLKISYDDAKNTKLSNLAFEPTNMNGADSAYLKRGFKYLILRYIHRAYSSKKRNLVLISAGAGGSSKGILKVVRKLNVEKKLRLALLLGPAINKKEIKNLRKLATKIAVFENADLEKVFAKTKIGICYFGVTMFEMIASKVVCAVYALNRDQNKQIKKLAKLGLIYDLGNIDAKSISQKIEGFFRNRKQIEEIFSDSSYNIDSKGAFRVAQVIQSKMLEKYI